MEKPLVLIWVKRIGIALVLILLLSISGFIPSSALSWDWHYNHSAQTASLPSLPDSISDGLVI
jgi:hypothetical protein